MLPSPPGAGALQPIGPGDPGWIGGNTLAGGSERVSDTTAVGETPYGTPQVQQQTIHGSQPELVKTITSTRVPILSSLIERGKTRSSQNEKDDQEELIAEKPVVAVPVDQVVIRIEVRDTGMGIKKKDVKDAKLFSPYVQVYLKSIISNSSLTLV